MIKKIFYPPWLQDDDVRDLLSCLHRESIDVKFVGGCVRDSFMNWVINDLDMAVDRDPSGIKAALTRWGIRTLDYGLSHGTVGAVLPRRNVEITSLRVDVQTYGRRAEVSFDSDWHADSQRRDFTINSIYLSPSGEVWDPNGGIEDLHGRIVRFIGDPEQRVQEDFLRILRFFRFSAFYGGPRLHDHSFQACVKHRQGLDIISIERTKQEMLKLLTSDKASATVEVMLSSGILAHILPEVDPTLARLRHLESQIHSPAREGWLRLVSLYAPDRWSKLGRAWKFSRRELVRIRNVLKVMDDETGNRAGSGANHGDLADYVPENDLEQKLFVYNYGKQCLSDLVLLSGKSYDLVRSTVENWNPPHFPINGDDLLPMIPGSEIGRVLSLVRKWWVMDSGMLAGREECLRQARQVIDHA